MTTTQTSIDLERLRIAEPKPARPGGKLLLVVLVLLIPAAFVLGWFLSTGGPGGAAGARSVTIETVRRSRSGAKAGGGFTEGGWIEVPSYHPVLVSSLVPGRVEELAVLEGSRVEAGDVVARLYAKDLEDGLRLAEAEVAEAAAELALFTAGYRQEEIAAAAADVARLEEEVRLAEKLLSRTRDLVPAGAASEEQLDRDESAVSVAKARLARAREDHRRLDAGFRTEEVDKARANLGRAKASRDLARSRLSYAEVKSPASGVVLERFVTPGTWVGTNDPAIVSLYDPTDLQVRVDVRQENSGRVRLGQSVRVSTEAEPDASYEGAVIRMEPLADLKKNTVQAKIKLADPGPRLHPEMICRVRFEEEKPKVAEESRALTVPERAISEEGGRTRVYVVRDGRAFRVDVRLGESADGRVEVLGGLSEGDRVVLDPEGLRDDMAVTEVSR